MGSEESIRGLIDRRKGEGRKERAYCICVCVTFCLQLFEIHHRVHRRER